MSLSVFDLFKIGLGPSSSHTVGPMWAALRFAQELESKSLISKTARVEVQLYGSLALTGIGHATDKAIILGLCGESPDKIAADQADILWQQVKSTGQMRLGGLQDIEFLDKRDIDFRRMETMTAHPNGMRFLALDTGGEMLTGSVYFSVGGGFVLHETEIDNPSQQAASNIQLPYPFEMGEELLAHALKEECSIAEIVRRNERSWQDDEETNEKLDEIWQVMEQCIERGCQTKGVLPGGLNVERRAPRHYQELVSSPEAGCRDNLTVLDWVNLYALAVNEENAAGGKVVTAPTNGAAGVIPAVGLYYMRFVPGATRQGLRDYLLTCAAIGMLYKKRASISAAEVGCQGEVGVACSMAAGGLCAVLGGHVNQVENAAEIGMEHNLGLTCDPIKGLVQIPCIERNTMGAVKAINAARLALRGDGSHKVSLDSVIATMRETGKDMLTKYKETSLGGLAVNIVEC